MLCPGAEVVRYFLGKYATLKWCRAFVIEVVRRVTKRDMNFGMLVACAD